MWHKDAGFRRSAPAVNDFNPTRRYIGYHFVIDIDGKTEAAADTVRKRSVEETAMQERSRQNGTVRCSLRHYAQMVVGFQPLFRTSHVRVFRLAF